MVCAACCHMVLVFAVMHLYNFFFIAYVHSFFILFFLNLVLINRRNGPRYQRVLALCAFLTEAIPKGLILRKFCVWCLCIFCFMLVCVRTDFVLFLFFYFLYFLFIFFFFFFLGGWWDNLWFACRVNRRQIEHSLWP